MSDTTFDIILRVIGADNTQADFNKTAEGAGVIDTALRKIADAAQSLGIVGQNASQMGAATTKAGNDTKAALNDVGTAATQAGAHVKTAAEESKTALTDAKMAALDFREAMEALAVAETGKKVIEFSREWAAETNKLEDTALQAQAALNAVGRGASFDGLKEASEHIAEIGHFGSADELLKTAGQLEFLAKTGDKTEEALLGIAAASRTVAGGSLESASSAFIRMAISGDVSTLAQKRLGVVLTESEKAALKTAQALDPLNKQGIATSVIIEALTRQYKGLIPAQSAGTQASEDLHRAWERLHEKGTSFSEVFASIDRGLTWLVNEFTALTNIIPKPFLLIQSGVIVGTAALAVLGGGVIFAMKSYQSMNLMIQASQAYLNAQTAAADTNSASQVANAAATDTAALAAKDDAASLAILTDEEIAAAAAADANSVAQLAQAGAMDTVTIATTGGIAAMAAMGAELALVAGIAYSVYTALNRIAPGMLDIGLAVDVVKQKFGDAGAVNRGDHNKSLQRDLDAIDENAGKMGLAADDPRVKEAKEKAYRHYATESRAIGLGKEAAEDLEKANQLQQQREAEKKIQEIGNHSITPSLPTGTTGGAASEAGLLSTGGLSGVQSQIDALTDRIHATKDKAEKAELETQLTHLRRAERDEKANERSQKKAEQILHSDARQSAGADAAEKADAARARQDELNDALELADERDKTAMNRQLRAIRQSIRIKDIGSEEGNEQIQRLEAAYKARADARKADEVLAVGNIEAEAILAEGQAKASAEEGAKRAATLRKAMAKAASIRDRAAAKAEGLNDQAEDARESSLDSGLTGAHQALLQKLIQGGSLFKGKKTTTSTAESLAGASSNFTVKVPPPTVQELPGGVLRFVFAPFEAPNPLAHAMQRYAYGGR